MKRILAREWLWLLGSLVAGQLAMAGLELFDTQARQSKWERAKAKPAPEAAPTEEECAARRKTDWFMQNAPESASPVSNKSKVTSVPFVVNGCEFPVGTPIEIIKRESEAAKKRVDAANAMTPEEVEEVALRLSDEPRFNAFNSVFGGALLGPLLYVVIGLARFTLWSIRTVKKSA